MQEDTRATKKNPAVVEYHNPEVALPVPDVLAEVLRKGPRELLPQAIEAEVAKFIGSVASRKTNRIINGSCATVISQGTLHTGIGEAPNGWRILSRYGHVTR